MKSFQVKVWNAKTERSFPHSYKYHCYICHKLIYSKRHPRMYEVMGMRKVIGTWGYCCSNICADMLILQVM
jgi:hypothetical protein